MPRYTHLCAQCGKLFEVSKPMDDAGKPSPCPDCKENAAQIIDAPAIHWRHTPKFHP